MLSQMIKLATEAHDGQFDKGGQPYILHPLTVMHKLRSDDEELNCIAVGHDLIEDTYVTEKFLRDLNFTKRIIVGILGLTKSSGESEDAYYSHVEKYLDLILVKKSDLRHNSDIRRLKGVTTKDILRMENYHKRFLQLSEAEKKFK
jgi:(p)ppGpp synthase/HD superfamily hydrolase